MSTEPARYTAVAVSATERAAGQLEPESLAIAVAALQTDGFVVLTQVSI